MDFDSSGQSQMRAPQRTGCRHTTAACSADHRVQARVGTAYALCMGGRSYWPRQRLPKSPLSYHDSMIPQQP